MIRRYLNLLLFKLKHPGCKVHAAVRVSRKTIVGKNCRLARGCSLSASVVIGDNVKVGEGTKLTTIKIGDNSMLESGIRFVGTGKGHVVIGKECYIGVNNIFDNSDNITIGDYVHIAGPSTALWCHSSAPMCRNTVQLDDPGRDQYRPVAPVNIESNVYVGGNCTIYPGIIIHRHAVVAPNSAVNKNVEAYTMVGGVPAKVIKSITD